MRFEELLNVIDRNGDYGEILCLEFAGNDEWNRVRSDCIDLLEPIFDYKVDSIGVLNGEFTIWLNQPGEN